VRNRDENRSDAITGYVIVKICPGFVLAMIAEAAAKRFGGFSVVTLFLAGWIACLLFTALLNSVTDEAA
jgi:hypothetical protein